MTQLSMRLIYYVTFFYTDFRVSPYRTKRVENIAVIFLSQLGGGFYICIDKASMAFFDGACDAWTTEYPFILAHPHTHMLSISHLKVCDDAACGRWFRQRWCAVTNSCC